MTLLSGAKYNFFELEKKIEIYELSETQKEKKNATIHNQMSHESSIKIWNVYTVRVEVDRLSIQLSYWSPL